MNALSLVDAQQREGQPIPDKGQCLKDPPLRSVFYRPDLCPTRGHVGDVKSEEVFPLGGASPMVYQVYLDKPRPQVVPLAESTDRDLMLKQSTGLCMGAPLQDESLSVRLEQPVDSCSP
jgi:hypothetical protein